MPAGRRSVRPSQLPPDSASGLTHEPPSARRASDLGIALDAGQPLEPRLGKEMGERFGFDFGDVRVHTSPSAAASAAAMNATAYTAGRDIVLGAGATDSDRALLTHELTHVVQQSRPGGATAPESLEAEARHAAIDGGITGATPVTLAAPLGIQRQAAPEPRGVQGTVTGWVAKSLGLPAGIVAVAQFAAGAADTLVTKEGATQLALLAGRLASMALGDQAELAEGFVVGGVEGLISPLTSLFGFVEIAGPLLHVAEGLAKNTWSGQLGADAEAVKKRLDEVGARFKASLREEWKKGWRQVTQDILGLPQAISDTTGQMAFRLGQSAGAGILAEIQAAGVADPKADPSAEQAQKPPADPNFIEKATSWVHSKVEAAEGAVLNTPWRKFGSKLGYALGAVVSNVVILVFTEGIGNAIEEVAAVLGRVAGALAELSETAGAAVRGLASVTKTVSEGVGTVERLIGRMTSAALKPLEPLLKPFFELLEELRVFLRKLAGVAEKKAAAGLETAAGAAGHPSKPPAPPAPAPSASAPAPQSAVPVANPAPAVHAPAPVLDPSVSPPGPVPAPPDAALPAPAPEASAPAPQAPAPASQAPAPAPAAPSPQTIPPSAAPVNYSTKSLTELRNLARSDPEAAEALRLRYRAMTDKALRERASRGDETAKATLRQQIPSNEEDLARALGDDYRPPHSATATVRDGNGRPAWRKQLNSGNMTAEERALGYPKNSLATHTEIRAVNEAPLTKGATMTISGQYPPCSSCQRAMQEAATRTGATITYWWQGGTAVFRP
ncbi:MAG: DUF4157 domain-containing protein [Solirubrobacteraceae bacterium]